jgi:hypothetical protein
VIDKTGIAGKYDFTLSYARDGARIHPFLRYSQRSRSNTDSDWRRRRYLLSSRDRSSGKGSVGELATTRISASRLRLP